MRNFIFNIVLALLLGCSQRLIGGPISAAPPPVDVALLYLTNNIDRNRLEGVFKFDNRLAYDDVLISGSSIESFDGTNWTFLTHPTMRRWDGSSDIRFPSGRRVVFQAWVPDQGGLYRLVLHSRMYPNIRTNTEIPSPAFRVSPGPPITQKDFIQVSPYLSDVSSLLRLSNQITNADRIIITNRFAEYSGFSISISGDEVRKIIKVVSSAKRMRMGSLSGWDWQLQFFEGPKYVASINFQGSSFVIGSEEYWEESGVLNKLRDEVMRKAEPIMEKELSK